jgi:hypothetical protein
MKDYRVEMTGSCREVYIVEASSEQEARETWMNGHWQLTEAFGMEVASVRLDDETSEDSGDDW